MKSILYVGATLMIGASIYGFVDYKQTHNKKEFKAMYVESPAEPEVKGEINTTDPVIATVAKEDVRTTEKKTDVKTAVVKNTVTKKKAVVKKKKRTFSTKLFSRGALDERYIKPVPVKEDKEEVKTDTKKTEEKEQ